MVLGDCIICNAVVVLLFNLNSYQKLSS